eukprot:1549482-Pleurochrysis_carterae.AAC.1
MDCCITPRALAIELCVATEPHPNLILPRGTHQTARTLLNPSHTLVAPLTLVPCGWWAGEKLGLKSVGRHRARTAKGVRAHVPNSRQ